MIIWKSKMRPETRGDELGNTVDWPCSGWRWILEVTLSWRHGLSVTLNSQAKYKSTGEWQTSHVGEWGLYLYPHQFREWQWGSQHIWYDGPHCTFSFGPGHLNYMLDSGCKMCLPDCGTPCWDGTCGHKCHQYDEEDEEQ